MKCTVIPVNGSDEDIRGKWKLVRGVLAFVPDGPRIEDYSCNDIIFHFQDDGMLSVTSDVEDHLGAFYHMTELGLVLAGVAGCQSGGKSGWFTTCWQQRLFCEVFLAF